MSVQQEFGQIFSAGIPVSYLLDYASGTYVTMSNRIQSMLGTRQNNFLTDGVSYTLDIYHKEEMKLLSDRVFADRINFARNIVSDELTNYLFSYNLRLRSEKGDYLNFIQKSCFLNPDVKGNPRQCFGLLVLVGPFIDTPYILQTVEKVVGEGESKSLETVFKKKYFFDFEDLIFTPREKEVLLWMAEGLGTKQIADRLSISDHTVINHKRHMLEKTGCLNSVALVSYAVRAGII